MRLDKLAVTAQEAFQASMGVAGDAQSGTIEPIHLLKAMLDASENNLSAIIKRIGADPAQLSQNVDAAIAAMPKASGSTMPMAMPSNNLMKVIDNAVKAAERMGDSYATTEHLLIALAQDKGDAGRVLNGLGIIRLRFAQPPTPLLALCATSPVPGESVPRGKAGNHSITSHPGKYHSKISRHVLPSSAIAFAPYWLRPTPWP